MTETPATDTLKADHQIILRVVQALASIVESLRGGRQAPLERIRKIITFSINFVDRCHHGKEEACLFPCLQKRGLPHDTGPIAVMLAEHEEGRRLVRHISSVIDSYTESDRPLLAQLCDDYVTLLTQHILKENNVLFSMADDLLTPDDQAQVFQQYTQIETQRLAPGEAGSLRRLADEIAAG